MVSGILQPDLKSVEELLIGDKRFRVPPYQRNFSWGPDEIEELWEDALAALPRQTDYFLGPIVLMDVPGISVPGISEIIDGQQRLASVTMIFSAIVNALRSRNDERAERVFTSFLGSKDYSRASLPKPKLELNRLNNGTFTRYVIDSVNSDKAGAALRDKQMHASNRLLLQAYKFFLDAVGDECTKRGSDYDSFLVPLIDCLRLRTKLIVVPVATQEDANVFFESLNARGKELAVSDLVKNRLYSEAQNHIDRAQALWEQMEGKLARIPIPEYLRHYWIAKKADEANLLVREKKMYRAITQEISGKKAQTIDLLKDLEASAQDYVKITDFGLWPDDPEYDESFGQSLSELRMFRISQCNPLLLNAIQVFRKSKDISRTFRLIANFAFRYYIIGNQSPGNLERLSGRLAYQIRQKEISSPKHIADALRAVNTDAAFRSDFELAVLPKSKARLARHILGKLNNHIVSQKGKSGKETVVNPDAKQVTLEHILPQSMPQKWTAQFSPGIDPREYIDRLGNLTLLAKNVNSDSADRSFAAKQREAFSGSDLPINASLKTISKWTETEIEQRQRDLAKKALEIWKV
jgi:hypothetical protein